MPGRVIIAVHNEGESIYSESPSHDMTYVLIGCNHMKTLNALLIAACAGIVGCGKPYETPANMQMNEIVCVPLGHVERSLYVHVHGSYTFRMCILSPQDATTQHTPCVYSAEKHIPCAYRHDEDLPKEGGDNIDERNRAMENESTLVNFAADNKRTLSFVSGARTPEGCYVIASPPLLR